MKKLPITLAVAAFAMFAAGTSHAFDLSGVLGLPGTGKRGGIEVQGNIDQSAAVSNATNSASGGGTALMGVASIREGDIKVGGNVDQSAAVGDASNVANGQSSVACLDVATVGDLQPCEGFD